MKKKFQKRTCFPIWGWFFVFFGVLFIANGFLVYFATTSFTGVSTPTAYAEGIAYQKELERQKRQAEEGWNINVSFQNKNKCFIMLDVKSDAYTQDDLSKGITSVTAKIIRPTHDGFDQIVSLKPVANMPGQYRLCTVKMPLKGVWDVYISLTFKNHIYTHKERLIRS